MNHQQLVIAIARRLPDRSRREVAEVLEMLVNVCVEQLSQPGQVVQIADLGRLSIDVHPLRASGVVCSQHGARQAETLTRLVGRFRPAPRLRQAIETVIKEEVY